MDRKQLCQRCQRPWSGPVAGPRRGERRCESCEADFRRSIGGDARGLAISAGFVVLILAGAGAASAALGALLGSAGPAIAGVGATAVLVETQVLRQLRQMKRKRARFLDEHITRYLPSARVIRRR